MPGFSWWPVALTWIVALALVGLLWSRFSRPPVSRAETQAPILGSTATRPRRVVPVWLAFVVLVVLAVAVWLTLRFLR